MDVGKPPLSGSAPERGSPLADAEAAEGGEIVGRGGEVLAQRSHSTTAWIRRRDYHSLRDAQMRQSHEREAQKLPPDPQQGSMKRTRSVSRTLAGCWHAALRAVCPALFTRQLCRGCVSTASAAALLQVCSALQFAGSS